MNNKANKTNRAVVLRKDFLSTLTRLTAENNHGKVYEKIAHWAWSNCDDNKNMAEWFRMFRDMFKVMNRAHEEAENFPYGTLRCDVGKEMDELIEEYYGKEVLDALNEACR